LATVAEIMATEEKAPAPFVSGQFREGDVRSASCDITTAKMEIEYQPMWPLKRGLAELLGWVRSELVVTSDC
jgi:dTDP-L-rhamnose 4-epimerase